MLKKYIFILIVLCLLNACYVFDPDFPYKDDPTTVGDFKSSKFDGFWQKQNFSNSGGAYQPILYIFRGNTFQNFGSSENPNNMNIFPEIDEGRDAKEFLYSDTMIYNEENYNNRIWIKTSYTLSSDGNNMIFSNYRLNKIDVEPWNKEDIFGSWYRSDYDNRLIIYTFNENSLVIKSLRNGVPVGEELNLEIKLTNEYYEGNRVARRYYYLYDNKLLFSSFVFKRYIDSDNE